MKFQVNEPDFNLSPYTGMTKKHWIELSEFIMKGVFLHIKQFDDPIIMPRHENKISYPKVNDLKWRYGAERFEGLARTFLIAAPLIKNKPHVKVNDYLLKDYYKNQILRAMDPTSESYWGNLEDILKEEHHDKAFQHTCECASLVMGLMSTKEWIWDKYSEAEKNQIATYLSEFGHYRTHHHNWRLFNMLILAFLKIMGYEIDEGIMRDHVTSTLSYYVGEGWYRDGHLFDYYSPWAFQVYGPIWNKWYGYEYEPEIANLIEEHSNALMKHYAKMFDKEGHMMMWGRSSIYRSAASAPLAANLFLRNPAIDPGLARRILSGNILQFVTREDMYKNNIPCLGFYGPFEPLVQTYSCATSPFWFANAFIGLELEDESPLWQAKETNGIWEEVNEESSTVTLDGPGISLTNHRKTGSTEMRTAKVLMKKDHPWLAEYSRLAFHSKLTWERMDKEHPFAMQYGLKYEESENAYSIPNFMLYGGERDGALYRRLYFDFIDTFQNNPSIDLADIPVANGFIRVDRVRIPQKPYELVLGHYGLPHINEKIIVEKRNLNSVEAVIGKTENLQLAFVPYKGWDDVLTRENRGKNPVTDRSTLIYGISKREKMYEYRDYILVTALLHKTDNSDWQEHELDVVKTIHFEDKYEQGGYGKIYLSLTDGREITVDFNELEGKLTI